MNLIPAPIARTRRPCLAWTEPEVADDDVHTQTLVKTRRAKAMARGGVEEQFALRLLVPGSLECAWQYIIDAAGVTFACAHNPVMPWR